MKKCKAFLPIILGCLSVAAGPAFAGSFVLVDTFGPGGTFQTGLTRSYGVVGSTPLLSLAPAVQFMPDVTASLTTITVAVGKGLLGSSFGFDISLLADADGKPGSVLESWDNLTPSYRYIAGGDPVTVTGTEGLWLTAGTSYWLQISPATSGHLFGGTLDQWNYNNQGISMNLTAGGPLGVVYSGVAPAFEITGNTPEPASLLMTGIGSGLLGLAAFLRKLRK